MSVSGSAWWDNYQFQVSLRGPKGGKIGLIFGFQDEKNYGLFRWTARPVARDGATLGAGLRELVRVVDGKEMVIHRAPGGYLPDQWYRAEILNSYSGLRVRIDGHELFEAFEPTLTAGAIGLWCDIKRPRFRTQDPIQLPSTQNSMYHLRDFAPTRQANGDLPGHKPNSESRRLAHGHE